MSWNQVTAIVLFALVAQIPTPAWGKCREWDKVETTGVALPQARHWPVMTTAGDRVHVFGGVSGQTRLSDFWSLTVGVGLDSHEWTQEKNNAVTGWSSSGGAIIGGSFFVYGGITNGDVFLGDTWRYTFHTQEWDKIEYHNETNPPELRNEHACASIGSELYLFGGWDGKDFFDNLWVLETLNGRWTEWHPTMPPTARGAHSMVTYAGNLYVYGGIKSTPSPSMWFGDIWKFSVVPAVWQQIIPRSEEKPTPRYGHTAVVYADRMYIFGGHTQTGYSNEFWSYDLERTTWTLVNPAGTTPGPRSAAGAIVHKHYLHVFGGAAENSQELAEWYRFDLSHCLPAPEPGPPTPSPIEIGTTSVSVANLVFLFILIAIIIAGFWMMWKAFKPATVAGR
jgi:N-acetylneuraminic acid mutarotase